METWIIGNWKMNGAKGMLEAYLRALLEGLPGGLESSGVHTAICPPYPYLAAAAEGLAGSPVGLGAQNVHPKSSGAFTGEVAPAMLSDLGVTLCLVGHSERRQLFGEKDDFISEKLRAVLAEGIRPVLCVGETLAEREAGRQEAVVEGQLDSALEGITAGQAAGMVVAYEPVWAIGTGKTATPEQAGEMHGLIRNLVGERLGESFAAEAAILYGGSVTPDNAGELLRQNDINGALVGGASLKAPSFLAIIQQAIN